MTCNRCEGTSFLNIHQLPREIRALEGDAWHRAVLQWIIEHSNHDVQICDCCGDGESWYGKPGEHDPADFGEYGPYAYNGGLPECY